MQKKKTSIAYWSLFVDEKVRKWLETSLSRFVATNPRTLRHVPCRDIRIELSIIKHGFHTDHCMWMKMVIKWLEGSLSRFVATNPRTSWHVPCRDIGIESRCVAKHVICRSSRRHIPAIQGLVEGFTILECSGKVLIARDIPLVDFKALVTVAVNIWRNL